MCVLSMVHNQSLLGGFAALGGSGSGGGRISKGEGVGERERCMYAEREREIIPISARNISMPGVQTMRRSMRGTLSYQPAHQCAFAT
jgi:hypothetical protein